jgi:hypothetical protein
MKPGFILINNAKFIQNYGKRGANKDDNEEF